MRDDDPIATGLDPSLVLPVRIAQWARDEPDRAFLVEVDGPTFTFAQVHDGMLRWAALLIGKGVGNGDRVVSFLPPSVAAHLVWLGCACIGALEVAVNPEVRGPLLDHVLRDAGPCLCVGLAEHATLAPTGVRFVTVDAPVPDVAPMAPGRWPQPSDA
ncbi:MAG: AMP-binding protein, partial [Acidimicrobiales bacterium]|nr:AMP-binding protein [Acidimicrobiales bacterium]